jgi:hypothetical protein
MLSSRRGSMFIPSDSLWALPPVEAKQPVLKKRKFFVKKGLILFGFLNIFDKIYESFKTNIILK